MCFTFQSAFINSRTFIHTKLQLRDWMQVLRLFQGRLRKWSLWTSGGEGHQWRWRSPTVNTDLFSEWNSEVSGFGWIYVVSWCVNLHLVDWNSVECLVWIELHWSMWQVKSHRLTLCVTFIHSSSHLTPTHITVLRSDYPLTMTDY